ncbi:ABC transporter permease [Mesobacillus maritimus]|uniref:ABC transporter permease n=1 Tax=Mesobacillus maritimus TaxID=1643336 RepID=A0ABS7KAK3_9BACI|nr:ABC transporter permease [Mesobacillus maritimus]MBY0099288.1 ABC transporter permease [Mesobacillus maritimus]
MNSISTSRLQMSTFTLFFQRLVGEWKFQTRIFRSILDWTVIVYILLPWLVVFGFIYRSWWVDQPDWIEQIPFVLFIVLGYLAAWTGNYRTFIQEADKVFLVKHPVLLVALKRISYGYSLLFHALGIGCVTLLFLPFFIHTYQYTFTQVLLFFVLLTTLKWFVMALKPKLKKIEGKFVRGVCRGLVFVLGSWSIQFIYGFWIHESLLLPTLACFLFTALAVALYAPHLSKLSNFEEVLAIEQEERNKYMNSVLTLSPELEKVKVSSRKRPWFYRKSKRIFKRRNAETGFSELFIKVFIRNSAYWSGFLQIVSVTAVALIFVPPVWIKTVVFIAFIVMLRSWLMSIWSQITISHPLTKKYRETDAFFTARKRVLWSLVIIGLLLVLLSALVGRFLLTFVML